MQLADVDAVRVEHSNKVKKILDYINDGLSEDDSVMLAGYSPFEYDELKEKFPKIAEPVTRAIIEYKRKLVSTLSKEATQNNDARLSQWLLEKRFGSEFNQKARQVDNDSSSQDYLVAAIKEVQRDGSSTTLIGIKRKAKTVFAKNDIPNNL